MIYKPTLWRNTLDWYTWGCMIATIATVSVALYALFFGLN